MELESEINEVDAYIESLVVFNGHLTSKGYELYISQIYIQDENGEWVKLGGVISVEKKG